MFCTKINCLLNFFSYLFLFLFETEQGNTEIFQLLLHPTPASRHPNFGEWIRLKPVESIGSEPTEQHCIPSLPTIPATSVLPL